MRKIKQPARMGRYTNLVGAKATHTKPAFHKPKKARHYPAPIAWFLRLSWPRRIGLLAGIGALLLVIIAVGTYIMYANDIKDPERLMNRNNTGIVLTDINGKSIYSTGKAEHRELIKLADISEDMKNAVIASEDKDFYKHGGFNVFSILRAAFTRVGGGSTITQQLAKNTILSDQRSFLRKWQELAMSIAIEQTYNKDQILEFYLNSVYFGENAFGVKDAAETYYGIEPKDLDLPQSAMLIGVLPAPTTYSPISGVKEYAKERQTTVLSRMVTNGYITEAEKAAALGVELSYAPQKNTLGDQAPHFAQVVLNELINKYGEEQALRSGYQVKTTLNLDTQQIVRDSVASNIANITRNGGSNAAAVVVDPKTGEVRAYVGSADWNNEQWGKVDMVQTKRQPGSSFKSIYYAAALADGDITASSMWKDELTDFGGGYKPLNADRKWHGDVSTRNAIAMSLNIPSVKIMQQYGIDKSIQAAKALGITTLDSSQNYGLSLSLGSAEVPLKEMTNAYAAFANQGQQYAVSYISAVKDKFGKAIYTPINKPKQAISKEGAYLISNILSDNTARVAIFGNSLTISGHTAAVKTGTTNDNRDAWTIGYTPNAVMGVWVGNNDNTEMYNGGVGMAGPIWRTAMTKMLNGVKNDQFVKPSSIVERSVCKSDGGLAIKSGSNTYSELFMAGALPTNTCNAEPVLIQVCNLTNKKIDTIDDTDYNEMTYSKDLSDCPQKITVCDLRTGQVVEVTEDQYDDNEDDYSTDTKNCKKQSNDNGGTISGTIQACDTSTQPPKLVTITSAQYANDTQGRYTTDLTKCSASTDPPAAE